MAFRSECKDATFGVHFRQPETEDKKLRKDPLEVLALKVPFGYVMLSE
jgi:hypothetical protein